MLISFTIALGSVALGVCLAFLPGRLKQSFGPLRTFAVTAALVVVLGHLLPEAMTQIGAPALAVFAVGLSIPRLLKSLRSRHLDGTGLGLELSYIGLLLHHVADGVGLGAYATLAHADHSHLDVMIALAAHTVPLVAIVAVVYRAREGTPRTLVRCAGIAAASWFGIGISTLAPAGELHFSVALLNAGVGGLLLHIVSHDLQSEAPDRGSARFWDTVAFLGGLSLLALSESEQELIPGAFQASLMVIRKAALAVVAGALLATVSSYALRRFTQPSAGSRSRFQSLCAEPLLSPIALFLQAVFFGWKWLIACGVLEAVRWFVLRRERLPSQRPAAPEGLPAWSANAAQWLAGALLSVLVLSSLPHEALQSSGSLSGLAVLLVVAALTFFGNILALLFAAALVSQGLAPSLVLPVLWFGVALSSLARSWQRRKLLAFALLGGFALLALLLRAEPLWRPEPSPSLPPPLQGLEIASALLLLGLVARELWELGFRLWLARYFVGAEGHGPESCGHPQHESYSMVSTTGNTASTCSPAERG